MQIFSHQGVWCSDETGNCIPCDVMKNTICVVARSWETLDIRLCAH